MADNRSAFQRDLGGYNAEHAYGEQQFKEYVGLGNGPAVNPIARAYGYFADGPQEAQARAAAGAAYALGQAPERYQAARTAGMGVPVAAPVAAAMSSLTPRTMNGAAAMLPTAAFGGSTNGVKLQSMGGLRAATEADGLTKGDVYKLLAANPRSRAPTFKDVLGDRFSRANDSLYAQERADAANDPKAQRAALGAYLARIAPALGSSFLPGMFDRDEE